MVSRFVIATFGIAVGVATATLAPRITQWGQPSGNSSDAVNKTIEREKSRMAKPAAPSETGLMVRITQGQTEYAQIGTAIIGGGVVMRNLMAPGTIVPDADLVAHVAVRVSATVAQMRKRLGDVVAKDEVLAVLESRQVADAKSEYLAAVLNNSLQQELFERDQVLWDKRVSNEQQYLRSRTSSAQSKMVLDIARQKLFALGLTQDEIAGLPNQPEQSLRLQEVRSPIAGRVVERKVDLGMAVGRDSLETELFVVMDLSRVWADLAVSPADLPNVSEGQAVSLAGRDGAARGKGKIIFISPLVDKETRAARVVAEIENDGGVWKPGSFVTAAIQTAEYEASIVVPASAIQAMANEKVVFVRTAEGFEKRVLVLGRADGKSVEVKSGLAVGEVVAVGNTFALKAELSKTLIED